MKSLIRFLAAAAMLSMAVGAAEGARLALWNTEGADTAQGSYEATETAEGVTAGPLMIGDGLIAGGTTASGVFAAHGYNTTSATAAMEAGDYWETSLTVKAGYELLLTGITVSFGGPKSGPMTCQLAWSTDDKKTWTYLREFDLTRTMTSYFVNSLSESELEDLEAETVWFRLVAWGGGTASTAVGSFGQRTAGLVFEGEVIKTEGVLPLVTFCPEAPIAYVGERLTVAVRARPSAAELTSITVYPPPEGVVTPNLSARTWTFAPASADFNKTFTVMAVFSNEYGEATGCVDVLVKGMIAEENGVTWRFCLDQETATVTGAYPAEGELIIPSFLEGYPVTSIEDGVFADCSGLTSVTIPDSVTNIARTAFADCSGLTCVTIPQAVCSQQLSIVFPNSYQLLTNVTIGTSVTSIGYKAFSGCVALTSVIIPGSITAIGASAFSDCNGLTSVHIHDLAAWSALSFSGGFSNPHYLFLNGEEVTDLVIPEGVTSIGEGPFSCCSSLRSIRVLGSVTGIGASAFYGCTNLLELGLSDGLTSIGTNAFAGCCSLKTLNIPHSVGTIGAKAFMGCSALSSLNIGRGVKSIGNQAFSECTALKMATLPKNVTTIGTGVFSGCTSLTSIMVLGNLEVKGMASPFSSCSNLNSLVFGGNVTTIGDYLCYGLHELTSVVMPPGVTNIGNRAFYECTSLKSLKFSDGLLIIGIRSLSGCSSLTSLTIPNTVTNIRSHAFENCQSLTTLYAPASWEGTDKLDNTMLPDTCTIVYGEAGEQEESGGTEIIENASWTYVVSNSAASIVHVTPAEGELVLPIALGGHLVTRIEDNAFAGCSTLEALTIPDCVTSVGTDVFSGCESLNELHVPAWWAGPNILANASVPDTCEIMYGDGGLDTESLDGLTWFFIASDGMVTIFDVYPVPEDLIVPTMLDELPVKNIGSSSFAGYHALKSATLPEGVTTIGYYAFQGCSELESVTILGNVTSDWKSDGNSPFLGCSSLTTVHFGKNMTKIGNYMFDQCYSLRFLTIPDSITNIGNRAFGFCSALTSLDLGQGLVCIGDAAFRACSALKSVMIPDSVTTIGKHAFYQCSGLEEVVVGSGARMISTAAFRDCSSLKSLTLPNGLERIDNQAFYNCSSLHSLWIPPNVTSIEYNAFYGCSALETLWVPASWEGTDMLEETGVPDTCMICYYKSDTGDNETTTTPVPVPYDWLEEHAASILEATTNDYEAAANAPASNEMTMWECYLVGLDPENERAAFTAKLEFVDGEPVLKWDPDLNEDGTKQERVYQVWARKSVEAPEPDGEGITDGWADVTDQETTWVTNGWRFFRVGVDLPK